MANGIPYEISFFLSFILMAYAHYRVLIFKGFLAKSQWSDQLRLARLFANRPHNNRLLTVRGGVMEEIHCAWSLLDSKLPRILTI